MAKYRTIVSATRSQFFPLFFSSLFFQIDEMKRASGVNPRALIVPTFILLSLSLRHIHFEHVKMDRSDYSRDCTGPKL